MNPVVKYFNGERMECLIAVLLGLVMLVMVLFFLIQVKKPFYSGIAYSFLLATFQVIVCSTVYFNNPKHIVRVNQIIQTDKSRIQTEELPRMKEVMKNFELYRWIEIGFLLAGLILFFTMRSGTLWQGLGAGLCLLTIQLLILDFFDERRGQAYLQYLKNLV